tara:strand:- start:61364 stop:61645 length:282 start_codon:yes stop_codon:yes gene_type:complete
VTDKKHRKKLKRLSKKKKEKKLAEDQANRMSKQMNMFQRMPDSCSVCQQDFPKTKEAHMTWRVVVRNEKQLVRLFCPDCQEKAKKLVENNNEV